jgi:hypothetical protein
MDAPYLRAKAKQCSYLADIAMNREVRDALDMLAREFEEQAAALERQRAGKTPKRDEAR